MEKTVGNWKSGQARLQSRRGGQSAAADRQASPKASPACNAMRSIAGRHCGGQATVEYAIVTGLLIALVAIMSLLLTTFGDYGERVLEMIASDYP